MLLVESCEWAAQANDHRDGVKSDHQIAFAVSPGDDTDDAGRTGTRFACNTTTVLALGLLGLLQRLHHTLSAVPVARSGAFAFLFGPITTGSEPAGPGGRPRFDGSDALWNGVAGCFIIGFLVACQWRQWWQCTPPQDHEGRDLFNDCLCRCVEGVAFLHDG